MTFRTVNRNQKAEYVTGSRAKGFYVFSIQGVERKGASTQYFSLDGEQKPTQDEAAKPVAGRVQPRAPAVKPAAAPVAAAVAKPAAAPVAKPAAAPAAETKTTAGRKIRTDF